MDRLARSPSWNWDAPAEDLRAALKLTPDEQVPGASMTLAGPQNLFLSLDPGKVGYPGCRLTATAMTAPEGRSEARALGTVIRIPGWNS